MIRWLVQSVVDHPDLTAGKPPVGLLAPAEMAQFQNLRTPRRGRDWLLGRWTAKQLVQRHIAATQGFSPALDSFTVAQEPSGAPYVASQHPALTGSKADGRMPLALSISHSHGYAFCALCTDKGGLAHLGADIERVDSRPATFAQEFFTHSEQANLQSLTPGLTDLLTTATWSAKEAILKATHTGLRVDPRSIQCLPRPAQPRHWTPLRATVDSSLHTSLYTKSGELGPLAIWWRVLENRLLPASSFVLTIAAYGVHL